MARSVTFSERPDVAGLLAQAEAETGLHDYGDDQFRGPLAAFTPADEVRARFAGYQQRFGL